MSVFIVQPPLTDQESVIVGKNVWGLKEDIQEVIQSSKERCGLKDDTEKGNELTVSCLEIGSEFPECDVIMSKPQTICGCDMGANNFGLVALTFSVKAFCPISVTKSRWMPQDYLRVALARSSSCRMALDVITGLISKHEHIPQRSDSEPEIATCLNTFVLIDSRETYIIESAGSLWAAKKIQDPLIILHNDTFVISTDIDKQSPRLEEHLNNIGLYAPTTTLNFKHIMTPTDVAERHDAGLYVEKVISSGVPIGAQDMFETLRIESCHTDNEIVTSSMVSMLRQPSSRCPSIHWFTATPFPKFGVFKPVIFTEELNIGNDTKCTDSEHAEHQASASSSTPLLQIAHRAFLSKRDSSGGCKILENIKQLELNCCHDVLEVDVEQINKSPAVVSEMFKHMCMLEMNFYKFAD